MTKQRLWWLGGVILLFVMFMVLVPLPFHPPGDTRMILDHTLQVYAAPPCFDDAGLTNNLSETTWNKASEKGYKPESSCTAEQMKPVVDTTWNKIMEMVGITRSPWTW